MPVYTSSLTPPQIGTAIRDYMSGRNELCACGEAPPDWCAKWCDSLTSRVQQEIKRLQEELSRYRRAYGVLRPDAWIEDMGH